MKLRVLGCSGGIGGQQLRTTSLLVDHDILIDAGTGLGELTQAELAAIDHVFITHSHLDHIAALPLMIDSVADLRASPVTVHATAATLESLRQHIFNWTIWPDFSEVSVRNRSVMQYRTIRVGQTVHLDGRAITAVAVEHTVPAVGYHLDSGRSSLVFTGDTTANDALWTTLRQIANLRYLLIETAFANRERPLAVASKHLCPSLLAEGLVGLGSEVEVFISHIKPGQTAPVMREIEELVGGCRPRLLENNQIIEF